MSTLAPNSDLLSIIHWEHLTDRAGKLLSTHAIREIFLADYGPGIHFCCLAIETEPTRNWFQGCHGFHRGCDLRLSL